MIKTRLSIILKKFFRNKLNYIIVLLIGICFSFSIMISSLSYSIKIYYQNDILNSVNYRLFVIYDVKDKDNLLEKLNSLEEIEGTFDRYGYVSFWDVVELEEYYTDKDPAGFWINGIAGSVKAVVGENLKQEDDMVIICPSVYYPFENSNGVDKTKRIDLKQYVGKYITLKYPSKDNSKEFKVKLIGLYDNDSLNSNYKRCYTTHNTLSKMNKEVIKFDKDDRIYYEIKNIVDEEKVSNLVKDLGYYSNHITDMNRQVITESFDTLIYISYGLFAISLLIISCIMYFNILRNKNNYAINILLGYNNSSLVTNTIIEGIILGIFSILVSLIIMISSFSVFKNLIPIYYPSFKYIEILISPNVLISAILSIIVLSIIIMVVSFIFYVNSSIYKLLNCETV